ncbi:hypothetical protein MNBD_IGNAVI01-2237 [hydrothermal vent metagenome]|uniref:3-oxoacyl-[acyl-carrier-protein] reductase n=1 Tax=hydrothermal vent metagenome TaxID=652676 RepID=A0A3B1CPX2_9ZZZZ
MMKRILILFGATGNLGKAILPELKNGKYDEYYLFGRNISENLQGNIHYLNVGDLTNEKDVSEAFNKIKYSSEDKLFLLSTVGGFLGGQTVDEINYSDWRKIIDLNLNISFLIAKHFIKIIRKVNEGSICFISAKTSLSAETKKSIYGLTKSGLNYLVQTLALEGKEYGMSANAIAPNIIDSEENRKWVKELSDLVSPEDIGKFVNQIFNSYTFVTGNIFLLPGTIKRLG